MSITIKDIAKKAGVSPSTVSRTINNHYYIREETNEKVRKVMDDLGYVYDKSHIKKHDVGVVFPRSMVDVYENPFYLEIVRGIKNLSSSYSYNPNEILELLRSDDCPSAFVVCDDIYAVIMVRLITEVGKKVPDDISIVSFNNSIFARFSEPPLTSIDVSPNQLGMEAVVQLIKHIETPTMFATRSIVPFTIRKRQSVKEMNKDDSH